MAEPHSLWRHRDFLKLWAGQTVSQFGNQFTGLALPIIAVVLLGASAGEMGLLAAVNTLPFLLFGLLIGVWVDRYRRRSFLIVGDLGRGIIVALIAGLVFAGLLRMYYLYFFAFLTGTLTVCFDVAYMSYLPSLVDRSQLVEANSKLETTNSTAQVAGPGIAGAVIQVFSAAVAMMLDALSFIFSVGLLLAIRKREEKPSLADRASMLAEAKEGLKVVFQDTRLRAIAGCTATANLFSSAIFALFIIFAVREIHLDASAIGLTFALGAVGSLAGAVVASPLSKRFGVGRTIIGGALLTGGGLIALPFATPEFGFPVMVAAVFLTMFGGLIYNINQLSLRQALVPFSLQGRLNATMRFLVWGTLPIGSVIGGVLGSTIGLRYAIAVGVVGGLFAFLWVLLSPVRHLRRIPEAPSEARN